MPFDEILAVRIRADLARKKNIEEKKIHEEVMAKNVVPGFCSVVATESCMLGTAMFGWDRETAHIKFDQSVRLMALAVSHRCKR